MPGKSGLTVSTLLEIRNNAALVGHSQPLRSFPIDGVLKLKDRLMKFYLLKTWYLAAASIWAAKVVTSLRPGTSCAGTVWSVIHATLIPLAVELVELVTGINAQVPDLGNLRNPFITILLRLLRLLNKKFIPMVQSKQVSMSTLIS